MARTTRISVLMLLLHASKSLCFLAQKRILRLSNKALSPVMSSSTHCWSSSSPLSGDVAYGKNMNQQDMMESDQLITVDENDVLVPNVELSKRAGHTFNPINPRATLHRAFSFFLFDKNNKMLLTQRAGTKITFPNVWTNTCCSHPLYGMQPAEVDPVPEGYPDFPGIKKASVRKLRHELGLNLMDYIDESILLDQIKFLTRFHYWAADTVTYGKDPPWGEHEVDYVLFCKIPRDGKDIIVNPNPEEVSVYKFVSIAELKDMVEDKNLLWSPWFRGFMDRGIWDWWADLDGSLAGKYTNDKVEYFDPPLEHYASYNLPSHGKLTGVLASSDATSSTDLYDLGYLEAKSAADLDGELMSTPGFTLEQLMELAGLSVAEATYAVVQEEKLLKPSTSSILCVCGPGNNGGDGLVAARHLKLFGYEPTVVYPKRSEKQPHYKNLVQQCKDLDIPILEEMPSDYEKYGVIIDSIFGFSFQGEPRKPFATILRQIKDAQDNGSSLVIAVDVPSGWNVNDGDVLNSGYVPDVLVSLTTAKLSAKNYPKRHFVGGRFLPPSLGAKYNVRMPPYPNVAQVMEVSRPPAKHPNGIPAVESTSTDSVSSSSNVYDFGYLDAKSAADLDGELMSSPGFTLEQLMELAGLSVAEATYAVVQEKRVLKPSSTSILCICGPGNNGGDGLVAARHLKLFGYDPTVVYPKRSEKQPHYKNLVQQCKDLDIPILEEMPSDYEKYGVIIDSIFGFSFQGEPREPFATILRQIKDAQDNGSSLVIAVDVPSGWNVNDGDVLNSGYVPDVLVSLTTAKLSAKNYPKRHFVGGRFLPPSLATKYNVKMPPYPNVAQVMEVNRPGK